MGRLFESFSLTDDHQIVPIEINVHDFLNKLFQEYGCDFEAVDLSPLLPSFFRIKMMRVGFSNPVLLTPCSYLT